MKPPTAESKTAGGRTVATTTPVAGSDWPPAAGPGSFAQAPPRLANTYLGDAALREYLSAALPERVFDEVSPALAELGELAAGEMRELARVAESNPPRLIQYDAWGNRVDRIEVSPAWTELHAIQARAGLCAIPAERHHGEFSRLIQHALLHLYGPSSAIYSCPVSMTDAAARTLTLHAPDALRDRVVPRLTSRDPQLAWTSGQWMTERSGGSDVGPTETVAREGADGRWRLHGVKWFTSATTAECALTLARPAGAEAGSRGLALFLVELTDPLTGEAQTGRTILVNRLKDKLGTKALPTAELTLDGAVATPIGDTTHGLRKIADMLTVCRLHNSVAAGGLMRRGQQLAEDYAQRRQAFGAKLADLPLHAETLAEMNASAEASFALTFHAMRLYGRAEAGTATAREQSALRALVPVTKLFTAKQAVAHASETLECFGGAGYVEDTGLPGLLRDAQVLPIWEGTTNILSLDLLRAEVKDGAVSALLDDMEHRLIVGGESNTPAGDASYECEKLGREVAAWHHADPGELQAGMRRFALRLGSAYSAVLLIEHARIQSERGNDRPQAVAQRAADWLD
ncbi:MAG: acyl-CoA dehydrogenase family protein [Solirubrobacterales bacterium]